MSYWENKRVLITGATGFIGSHLFSKLESNGAITYGISRSIQTNTISKLSILNLAAIDGFIKRNKIEICFHLAADAIVERGQSSPHAVFKTNYLGTLNILESARRNNLEKVIIASTSHVYGNNPLPYKEEYTPMPSRPYETSKTCVDLIAQSYTKSFNLPVLIPRFVNIFGPGDKNFTRLVPKTIKSVIEGNNPEMWGGNSKRQYLYIDDAVSAYLKLGEIINVYDKNNIYNFGTDDKFSVEDVIRKILALSGKKLKIRKTETSRIEEIKNQYVSWEKAKRKLRWQPKFSFDNGLALTIEWYKEYFSRK